jgi:hypothetical protein
VLRERLSEKHGLFLEWTIIVLIAIGWASKFLGYGEKVFGMKY